MWSSQTNSSQSEYEIRKQRTREFRQQHFILGFDQSGTGDSQYKQAYQEHGLGGVATTQKEMSDQKHNLRATHFILGTDNPGGLYSTSSGDAFIEQNGDGRGKLSQETKNDLRSHHFIFGNDSVNQQSVYKANYIGKEIDVMAGQNRKDMAANLRKHDFEFGDDQNDYNSMYKENHVKAYDPTFLKQGKSKDEIMNQIVELRQTNLNLGDVKPDFRSQAMTEFNDQGYCQVGYKDIGLKNSNIVLGNDQLQYGSYAQECYNQQFKPADQGVNKSLAKDLRKEHFKFGEEQPMYTSQARRNFIDFAKESLKKQQLDGDFKQLQKNHFSLGTNNEAIGGTIDDRYRSQYSQQHNQSNHDSKNQSEVVTYKQNNVVFGSEVNQEQFVSEARSNFINTNGQSGQLSVEQKSDLRRAHYQLGNDDTSQEKSHYKDIHTDQNKNFKGSQLEDSLQKDLRSHHFVYGFQHPDMQSVGSDIGQYQGPPAQLDPVLAQDLRSHHWNNAA